MDYSSLLFALAAVVLLFWRLGINKKIAILIKKEVAKAVGDAVLPLRRELAEHTVKIEGLHRQTQDNKHRIVQLVWAGANSVASAAIWSKEPPNPRQVKVAINDYRYILGSDDIDSIT